MYRRYLQLSVLWIFTIAQPLYALLSNKENTPFFIAHNAQNIDIVFFTIILALMGPAILEGLLWLVGKYSLKCQNILLSIIIYVLFTFLFLPILKTFIPDLLSLGFSLVLSFAFTRLYFKKHNFQTYLLVLSPCILILPLTFLLFSPIKKIVFPSVIQGTPAPNIKIKRPIVLIVFDELPLTSLLESKNSIDGKLFPHFNELKSHATWYRKAATRADRTSFAVPFIFSGIIPSKFSPGIYKYYPNNLFTLLGRSHHMAVVESISSLCPRALCRPPSQSYIDTQGWLFRDATLLYLHIVLPRILSDKLPSVDKDWADFGETSAALTTRRRYFNTFMSSLSSKNPENTLYVLHLEMPHSPWVAYPSGAQYIDSDNQDAIFFGIKATHTIKHQYDYKTWENDWVRTQAYQRHLLQLGYTDLLLGKIMSRLKQLRIYNDALIVVVADHGINFDLAGDMRGLDKTNIVSIINVPLFIKYPGQSMGTISNIPAETTDIVPTIADVLNTSIPWTVEGVSLRTNPFPKRDSVTVFDRDMLPNPVLRSDLDKHECDPLILKKRLFKGGLFRIGPAPDMIGHTVKNYRMHPYARIILDKHPMGSLIFGRLSGIQDKVNLALSIDGKVVSETSVFPSGNGKYRFYFMIPYGSSVHTNHKLEIFQIAGKQLIKIKTN